MDSDHKLSEALWLAFEHGAMHLETFLYMLLQSQRTYLPPGVSIPDFESLARAAEMSRESNVWHKIPATKLKIGINDSEHGGDSARYFSWDNEQPIREISVSGFKAQSRCISNGEYAAFLEQTSDRRLPASWIDTAKTSTAQEAERSDSTTDATPGRMTVDTEIASPAYQSGKFVKTMYGLIPLKYALDWPVMASYDELAAYAQWAGGRIPSFEEAKNIYQYVESQKAAPVKVSNSLISAVNG